MTINKSSFGFGLKCSVAAAVLCFGGSPALAAAASQPLSGPGSLHGVWISARFGVRDNEGGPAGDNRPKAPLTAEGKPVPLMPWAAKLMADRMKGAEEGHPHASSKSRCLPAGTPGSMLPPASLPLQIIESPGQVTVLFEEFNQFRIIYMNEKHAEEPEKGYFGNSVGYWEGGALVVDTIGLNDQTTVGNDMPHTDALHVVERIRRNGDVLEIESTFDDPKTFTSTWKSKGSLKKVPGIRLAEYFCENDRNTPDETGRTGVQLSAAGE